MLHRTQVSAQVRETMRECRSGAKALFTSISSSNGLHLGEKSDSDGIKGLQTMQRRSIRQIREARLTSSEQPIARNQTPSHMHTRTKVLIKYRKLAYVTQLEEPDF